MMAPRHATDLRGLDALRGMLACYVLAGHARWLLWAGHSAWIAAPHAPWEAAVAYGSGVFRYGREAVLIFFALSGFFIHLRAAERLRHREPVHLLVGRYAWRRAHRLVPTFYFALAVTVVCDAVGRWQYPTLYRAATGDALLDGVFAMGGYSAASVLPGLAMLPSSWGRDFGSNGPLWSIAYEVVYYALYPGWLMIRRRSAVAAYVGVPLLCLTAPMGSLWPFLQAVLGWYPVWLCGAGLVELATRAKLPGQIISVVLFGLGLAAYLGADLAALRVAAAVVFAGAAVCVCVSLDAVPGRPVFAAAEYLGRRSYTIYAMHFPLLALGSAAVIEVSGARPLHGWFALGGVVAALAVTIGLFHLCERHFIHDRLQIDRAAAA